MVPAKLADAMDSCMHGRLPRSGGRRGQATPPPGRKRCMAVRNSSLLLGIDVGTQGAKAIVYDPAERCVLSRASESYDILPTEVPGRAEQWPSTWTDAAFSVAARALDSCDRASVRAIGVSGQQHTLVMLDEEGRVIRPAKLWCDTESAQEAEQISTAFQYQIPSGFTGPKILWMQRHEPDTYATTRSIMLPASYVNFVLTGNMVIDASDSSGTGFFDSAQRCFDRSKCDHIDKRLADQLLPRLAGPSEVVGSLLPGPAEALGLSTEVVVSVGSGDNAASALGVGAVNHGDCVISLGTSGTLFGCFDQAVLDPSGTIAPFCDATGRFLPLVCTMNCTNIMNEVREAFGLGYDDIEALAMDEAPGCSGMNMLPFLTGERTPNWPTATAAVLGIGPGMLRPGLLYRAAMEGATFALLAGFATMQELGFAAEDVRLVGGGSRSKLFQQIVADAFQLPVRLPMEADAAAVGAALQAGAAMEGVPVADFVNACAPALQDKVIRPCSDEQHALAEAFQRHKQGGAALFA